MFHSLPITRPGPWPEFPAESLQLFGHPGYEIGRRLLIRWILNRANKLPDEVVFAVCQLSVLPALDIDQARYLAAVVVLLEARGYPPEIEDTDLRGYRALDARDPERYRQARLPAWKIMGVNHAVRVPGPVLPPAPPAPPVAPDLRRAGAAS